MRIPKPAKALFALLLLCTPAFALTEEENKALQDETKGYEFKTVTTREGLNFSVPEDMPIVVRNGIKAPLPFEEYLYMKFKKLEEKLDVIDKKIDKLSAIFAATQEKEAKRQLTPQEQAGLLSSS